MDKKVMIGIVAVVVVVVAAVFSFGSGGDLFKGELTLQTKVSRGGTPVAPKLPSQDSKVATGKAAADAKAKADKAAADKIAAEKAAAVAKAAADAKAAEKALSLDFGKDSSSPTVDNSTMVGGSFVLAKFYVKPIGDGVKLTKFSLAITDTGVSSGNKPLAKDTEIKIMSDNNDLWTGNLSDISTDSSNPTTLTPTYTPDIYNGSVRPLTIEVSGADQAVNYSSLYKAFLDITEVKWATSSKVVDPAVNQSSGNGIQVNIKSAFLNVENLSGGVSTDVNAGSANVELAKFKFDSVGSNTWMSLGRIEIDDNLTNGAKISDIMNLVFHDDKGHAYMVSVDKSHNKFSVDTSSRPIVEIDTASIFTLGGVVSPNAQGSHEFSIKVDAYKSLMSTNPAVVTTLSVNSKVNIIGVPKP